jgi:hypothetical protein
MFVPRAILFILIGSLSLKAATIKTITQRTVKVCLAGDGNASVRPPAEAIASRMFADIGIELEWYHDNHHCKTPPDDFLNVVLSTGAPASRFPGALAYSHLHDHPYIEVFCDRVAITVEPRGVPNLLGHVLAHEIAHVLGDSAHHSEAGIMKAHWDVDDIHQLCDKPLSFTTEDAELIQRGVAQRTSFAYAAPPR